MSVLHRFLIFGLILTTSLIGELSDGLVVHYEFEEDLNDSAGNHNGVEHENIIYTDGVLERL